MTAPDRELHPDTWDVLRSTALATSLVTGEVLAELGRDHPEIVALSADLAIPTRIGEFGAVHPERFFDVGIAEKNMVSIAAGLAACGKIPYCSTYASFLALLCCEQIRTDVAYPRLNVRLIGTHAGIAMGFYGTSHHATEDLAVVRAMANMTVVAPCDAGSLRWLLEDSVAYDGPIYFRLSRGRDPDVYAERPAGFRIGAAETLRSGGDVVILATGTVVRPALDAATVLAAEGVDATVIDAHTVKPLDVERIVAAASATGAVLTVEEHNVLGGLGGAVAETLLEQGVACRFRRHGLRDEYSVIGPPLQLYEHYRLDAAGIAGEVRCLLGSR